MFNCQQILQSQFFLRPLISRLSKRRIVTQFVIYTSLIILISCFFYFLSKIIPNTIILKNDFEFSSLREKIFIVVLFAPLIETLFIQFLIIEILYTIFPRQIFLACLISSTIFSLNHLFSILYILSTFWGDLSLRLLFFLAGKDGEGLCLFFVFILFITFLF